MWSEISAGGLIAICSVALALILIVAILVIYMDIRNRYKIRREATRHDGLPLDHLTHQGHGHGEEGTTNM